jgi:hypothetical protein
MRNEPAVDPSRIREEIEGLRHLTTGQLKDKYRKVFGEDSDPITSSSCSAASPGASSYAAERQV